MKARFTLSILMLLAVNLAWIWRIDQADKENARRLTDSSNRYMEISRELYLMNHGWEYTILSNNMALPKPLLAKTIDGSVADFPECTRSGEKLVLVLSDRHCSTCVDQLLFTVKNEFPQLERDKIIVLFSSTGPSKEQWHYREKILDGVRFLEIADRSLHLPLDTLDIPYVFVTGPEHIADLTFTPYPTLESQTHKYLEMVRTRFFK
jgi:hypothetical protein